MKPAWIEKLPDAHVVCITTAGYMLVFPLEELPELAKGKGNKLINIPAKRLKSGEEKLAATLAITPEDSFLVHAGARYIRFKWKDLPITLEIEPSVVWCYHKVSETWIG